MDTLKEMRGTDWSKRETALTTLLTILNNIVKEPDIGKYKVLKLSGKKLSTDVLPVYGCDAFLHEVGFRKVRTQDSEVLQLKPQTSVAHVTRKRDELQDFIKDETMSQKRRERDKRIAAAVAAEGSSRPLKPARTALALEARRTAGAAEESGLITVTLQSFTGADTLRLDPGTRVSDLRERVARRRGCSAAQVRLVVQRAYGPARLTDDSAELLSLFGIAGAGTMSVTIGAKDEFQEGLEAMPVAAKPWERQLADTVKQKSYRFTIQFLDDLVGRGGLEDSRRRELTESLDAGQLTAKEVRDIAVGEAKQEEGIQHAVAQLNHHVQQVKLHHQDMASVFRSQERDQQYSEMISRENYEGLKAATKQQG